jgi:hypothetical protein
MTPQERKLVDDLFDRLSQLEPSRRDADAERAIADGIRRAPNAVYALVQTVLVQDEALRRADARIRELTDDGAGATGEGGFLDSMRAALGGRAARTSVPSVAPGPEQRVANPAIPASGGSFLGAAAASAAGVIGGALLLNSISSMFGHRGGSAFAAVPPPDQDAANSDLAREAGIHHIGQRDSNGSERPAQLFGDDSELDDSDSDFAGDFDGDFGGDL